MERMKPYKLFRFNTFKIFSGIFNPKDMDCSQYYSYPIYELNTEHIRSTNRISKTRYVTLYKMANMWEFMESSHRTRPVEQLSYSEFYGELYPGDDYEIYVKTIDCMDNVDYGNMNMYNEEDFGCEVI